MRRVLSLVVVFLLYHLLCFAALPTTDPAFQALKYRNLGPTRGGRVAAVTGVPSEPHTFYMGASGGVWKTENAGQTWTNISDKYFESGSIGAIAVAESDPNVVYVGTGQSTLRGNVALGVGMYKSTDAGKSWNHAGLRNAGQIGRVRVHPANPDLVYVAVIGNAFMPNEDRGLYRSKDGGKSWEKVLHISSKTGFADLAMDASNPRVLYAAAWTGQRLPWTIISGSEEGGLYKSADGGDTWNKLTEGLPQGIVGKIGVAVSPANPNRVWALVEHENGGLFRSEDAGATWKKLEAKQTRRLYQRAWYYMHIFADPKDEQTVYILNVDQFRSKDGGINFETFSPNHGDGHDLWINPNNTRIMIEGDDGGATVSLDGGKNWSTQLNQPTAEIYNVAVDGAFPYRVYGAQQDNTTISLPSRATRGITPYEEWRDLGGGESGHIGFEFHEPDIVYAGSYGGEITRLNMKTGEMRNVMAYPQMEIGLAARDLRYRFNWNAPLFVSRHNPKALYYGSQHVHRSTDEGQSWQVLSPDLSRNEKSRQDYSGSPITKENTGIEVYSNLMALEESPLRAGVIWAGSDDGLVHVSDDEGKNWRNVTPKDLPEWGTVNTIEPSPHDPARAYIAVHKYRLGDSRPYIFRTDNYGKTWNLLTNGKNGIAANVPTRVVREDLARKGLLYAGTETGIYVSMNDGGSWQHLQANLPIIPVTDLAVHQNDLVVSTQGRSFWILDDLTVVQQVAAGAFEQKGPVLLKPRDVVRMRMHDTESNPPRGAMIFYSLPEGTKEELTLEFHDHNGQLIQRFSSERPPNPNPEFPYGFMGSYQGDLKASKNKGLNRFVWDLRYPVVDFPKGTIVWGYLGAPKVAPGEYSVTMTIGANKQQQEFRVLKDPRVVPTEKQTEEHVALMVQIRDELNKLYQGVRKLRTVRQQAKAATEQLEQAGKPVSDLRKMSDDLSLKLSAIEETLMQPKNEADQDTENFPTKIDNQLAYISLQMDYSEGPPTDGQKLRVQELQEEIEAELQKLKAILETDVQAFNKRALELGLQPLMLP